MILGGGTVYLWTRYMGDGRRLRWVYLAKGKKCISHTTLKPIMITQFARQAIKGRFVCTQENEALDKAMPIVFDR